MEKGWHIYWVNPGDSGQPPVFKWQLPEGFTAGEIQWPRPDRMQNTPQLADYGYHDDVLLMVPVRVSSATHSGAISAIKLDAKWLICREVCLADQARLSLSLPVSSASQENRNNEKLFADASKLVPRPWPRSWRVWAARAKGDFILFIDAGRPLQPTVFFPLEPNQIENAAPQSLQKTPRGAKIVLKGSDQLLKFPPQLKGVLVLASGESYQVRATVTKQ
jgi:thiol:disulfide interchange protein DsbD